MIKLNHESKSESNATKRSDDYSTNQFGLKYLAVLYLLVVIVWILNQMHLFIIDPELMNHAFIGETVIILSAYILHFFVGYEHSLAKYFYLLSIYALVTYMSIFLTYHIAYAMVFPMIFALQYRRRSVTIFSYVLALLGIIISVVVGYYRGLCDANMLLLTYTTTANQIEIFSSQPLVFNNELLTLILYYATPRCMIISTAVPLLNHIGNTITQKAIRELENKKMAETDGLTGVLNKNAFLSEAKNTYNNLGEKSGALIFIDMDHFKSINDNLGHATGDIAIQEVAKEIQDVFRQGDLIGRFGGDEFVVFVTNMPLILLNNRLEELRSRMEKTYSNENSEIHISASMGAVFFKEQPEYSFEHVLSMADDHVYISKDSGRNKISLISI